MRLSRLLPLLCLLLAAPVRPAFADATLFLGTITAPSTHATKGFAIGAGFVIVGAEFEYASTKEDPAVKRDAFTAGGSSAGRPPLRRGSSDDGCAIAADAARPRSRTQPMRSMRACVCMRMGMSMSVCVCQA